MYRVVYVLVCQKKRKLQKEISELKCRRESRRLRTTALTARQGTVITSSGGDNGNDGQDIFTRAGVGTATGHTVATTTTKTKTTDSRDTRQQCTSVPSGPESRLLIRELEQLFIKHKGFTN
jgi:hypothetical protein